MFKDIKLILKSVRENKWLALMTPLFMIGEVAVDCLLPYVMTLLFQTTRNATSAGDDINIVLMYSGILLALAICSAFFGIMGGISASRASNGLAKNLREDIYAKLQTFSFENIDHFSSSSLITRMTTDINLVQQSFQMCTRIVVRAPTMFVFSIIMAGIIGGPLAIIFVITIPVMIVGLLLIVKRAYKIFTRVFKRYDKVNESIQENVSGIRVVKSYVREDHEIDKFNKASDAISYDFIKAEKLLSYSNPLMMIGFNLGDILIFMVGSYFILTADNTVVDGIIHYVGLAPEQISSVLTYSGQVLISMMTIAMIITMLTMSLQSVHRVCEVLREVPTIVSPENPITEIKNGDIKFDHVSFKYKASAEKCTLKDINLDIKNGEFVGILGSTGCGKTSLVNLISRLYDINEGHLLVGDHDVKEYDLDVLRNNVSVVLQKNVLFSGTIKSNLLWGDENASDEEIKKACHIAQIDDFIESLPEKYDTHIEQGGTNVSGGQKQRLCIARAILKKPKVLILDDSTSAVDTKTDALIRAGLKNEIPETTKIVIAQRISSIEDADKIIILDNGEVNAVGTHEELLKTNKIYQEVYNTQTKGGTK